MALSSIYPGLSFGENTLKKETSLTTRQARMAVELAWDKYHHAALGGTLASPTIQTDLEMNLHKSRALLAEAYDAEERGDTQQTQSLVKQILKITEKVITESQEQKKMIAARKFLHVIFILGLISSFQFLTEVHANDLIPTSRDLVEMKIIPAGEFLMGSKPSEGRPDERPQSKVYLDAYAIDIYEVTNERYLNFIHLTGRKEPPNPYGERLLSEESGIGSLPVVQVTWYDAVDYCRWAGKRLPTEAEWEKAARGDRGSLFPWGSESPGSKPINFERNWQGTKTLWPVGSHRETSSPYEVHDMSGNVREWTQDWYAQNYYADAPKRNPQGPGKGILKVIKGGSCTALKPIFDRRQEAKEDLR